MAAAAQSDPINVQVLLEEHLKALEKFKQGLDTTQSWKPHIGQTPHTVVWQEGKLRLLHYPAQGKKICETPLLIVFSLINRSYILDLKPGKSIVERMTQLGFDVYLIDWGETGAADQFLTLDDYVNRYMWRVVKTVKEQSGQPDVSMLGYCMGGTMAGMYAALYPEDIRNLILMAAPFDFTHKDGLLMQWTDRQHFNVDKLVASMGNIPPWFLQSSFTMLKPMQNMLDKYVKFYENIENKAFVDDFLTLEYWLNDNIPLSGQVYKQFVEDCFQHNRLIHNRMKLGAHTVHLDNIECPVLTIIAQHDHLVPPTASTPLHDVISSKDKDMFVFPAGHIGLSVSGRAMKDLWPRVGQWLEKRSEPIESKPVSKPTKGKSGK